ncbi:MAG TPA: hypothetical protein VIJ27_04420 [Mucilaginibacter sp.]
MATQLLNHKSGGLLPARSILPWHIAPTAVRLPDTRYFSPLNNNTGYLFNNAVNHSARE